MAKSKARIIPKAQLPELLQMSPLAIDRGIRALRIKPIHSVDHYSGDDVKRLLAWHAFKMKQSGGSGLRAFIEATSNALSDGKPATIDDVEDGEGDAAEDVKFCQYCGEKLNADGKCEKCDDGEDPDEMAKRRRLLNVPPKLRAFVKAQAVKPKRGTK